jgi:hypothetical protein
MAKQVINEEFRRMQKLAGLLKEEDEDGGIDNEFLESPFFPHDAKILTQDNQHVVVEGGDGKTPLLLTKQQYKEAIDEYNQEKQWYIDNYPDDENPGYGVISIIGGDEGQVDFINMFNMKVLDMRDVKLIADLEHG